MPIKQSAKKAAKQAVKRRAVNVLFKDQMKLAIKAVKNAAEIQSDNLNDLMIFAQKRIDKASKKNIVTKQSASRKKSSLMKMVNYVQDGSHVSRSEQSGITKIKKSSAKKPVIKKTTKSSGKKISK